MSSLCPKFSPPQHISSHGRSDGHDTKPRQWLVDYLDLSKDHETTVYVARIGKFYHIIGDEALMWAKRLNMQNTSNMLGYPSLAWPDAKHFDIVRKFRKQGFEVKVINSDRKNHYTICFSEKHSFFTPDDTGTMYTLKGYDGFVKARVLSSIYEHYDSVVHKHFDHISQQYLTIWSVAKQLHIYVNANSEALEIAKTFPGFEMKETNKWILNNILNATFTETEALRSYN